MPHYRPSQKELWELTAALLVARNTVDPMVKYDAMGMGDRASMALEQALALNATWGGMADECDLDSDNLKTSFKHLLD